MDNECELLADESKMFDQWYEPQEIYLKDQQCNEKCTFIYHLMTLFSWNLNLHCRPPQSYCTLANWYHSPKVTHAIILIHMFSLWKEVIAGVYKFSIQPYILFKWLIYMYQNGGASNDKPMALPSTIVRIKSFGSNECNWTTYAPTILAQYKGTTASRRCPTIPGR